MEPERAGLWAEESDSLSYSEVTVAPERRGWEQAEVRSPSRSDTVRPDTMTYSEIRLGPQWEECREAGPGLAETGAEGQGERPREAGLRPEGAGRTGVGAGRMSVGAGRTGVGAGLTAVGAERTGVGAERTGVGEGRLSVGAGRTAVGAEPAVTEEEDAYYLDLLGEDEVIYDLMYASGRGSIEFWRPQDAVVGPALPGHTASADRQGELAACCRPLSLGRSLWASLYGPLSLGLSLLVSLSGPLSLGLSLWASLS